MTTRPRLGRPRLGRKARPTLTFRIDPDLLTTLRRQARVQGIGYQVLIHRYLEREARREQSVIVVADHSAPKPRESR